jgi:hypothetical protein
VLAKDEKHTMLVSRSQSYQTFFLRKTIFFSIFFAVELGHVKIHTILSDVTNNLDNEKLKFVRSQVYNVRLI